MPAGPPAAPPTGGAGPPPDVSAPEEGDLRLAAQRELNSYTIGALQIFRDGSFATFCQSGFREEDARVACRELGFVGGAVLRSAGRAITQADLMEEADGPLLLENPSCAGSEARLLDCPARDIDPYLGEYNFGVTSCFPGTLGRPVDAFIACGSASGPSDGELRLTGGVTSEDGLSRLGRLEYANRGGWGLVCDSLMINFASPFGAGDARVACRSLGFEDGIAIAPSEVEDEHVSLLPFWLVGAACAGTESSLADCPDHEFALGQSQFCTPEETIELVCSSGPNPELDGRLRLMGGDSGPGFEYGRLEIFIRGFWSAVCDNRGFTPEAAGVACRALGFDGGAVLQFSRPDGTAAEVLAAEIPPGISAVDCDGTEASLLDCTSSEGFQIQGECSVAGSPATAATMLACGTESASCDQEPAPTQDAVRLRGGFGSPCDPLHSGIVEIFNAGEWGAVCLSPRSRLRDAPVADVICRQLGFPFGSVVDGFTTRLDLSFEYYNALDRLAEEAEDPQGRFWLNGFSCAGTEPRLVDCDLGDGFLPAVSGGSGAGCMGPDIVRLRVACRQFRGPEVAE